MALVLMSYRAPIQHVGSVQRAGPGDMHVRIGPILMPIICLGMGWFIIGRGGKMALTGELVTLINRDTHTRTAMKNGQTLMLKPGENPGIDSSWVFHAKNQNPVWGTESPFTINVFESWIGVKDTEDKVDVLLDPPDSRERLDGSRLVDRESVETGWDPRRLVPGRVAPTNEIHGHD